ncbi:nicotinate-nucleotide adenylyltransferase [Tissierella sp. MB52-C2]|uniref:nicotinate-nucleotide adenylyltransferase n=1 Tax=Tissierella sp. MB52-C2 TaxID=3070999 RepID=UPI00280A9607|nr:nicotinate-nucleotide adenylyltransferase [Tissierella sp. MB52-C2]WMM23539.1 nicotinate-nucleotide adenylyltransferase [Tissierella sp. MB52-C2]
MKIAVMGGTFDPIHNGHLIVAEYVRTSLKLDKVVFIPSGVHPFKNNKNITEGKKRLDILSLAIKSNEYFDISAMEINREGITYTIDTIKELKKIYKEDEVYFIIGSDIIFEIEKWKGFEELVGLCKFILLYRPGKNEDKIENRIEELKKLYGLEFTRVEAPLIEISSTEIRERVKEDLSIKYLVPEIVEDYIYKHKLYSGEIVNG